MKSRNNQNNQKNGTSKKKSKKPHKGAGTWDGSQSIANSVQALPRRVGLILPDRYRTNLRYWKSISFNFVATSVQTARFRPSAAFDVDPLIAGTAMSGFVELSGLYNSYRVLASHIRVEAANTSNANPVALNVTPVNLDPGASPSAAYVLALREQPYSKFKMLGFAGSPPANLQSIMSTEKIYGSKAALFDDSFSSPVTTSPNNNWFWVVSGYIGVLDPSLTWLEITIDVDVEFFDRAFLQN